MSDLPDAEAGDRDDYRTGVRGIDAVVHQARQALFRPWCNHKGFDGQWQFERKCFRRLADGFAALLEMEFPGHHRVARFKGEFEQQRAQPAERATVNRERFI